MGDVVFANPALVHGIWPALALGGLLAYLELRGRDALHRFVSAPMQERLAAGASRKRRIAKIALASATLLFGVGALMRPQTPGGVETVAARKVGADIVVVLDVSKSMLADDAAPNRLARAKADIAEFVDHVSGHRVGLVAFAGRAAVMSPLTTDYGFFHLVLGGVDHNAVARGGTRLGDAIHKGVDTFGANRGVSRLMLLITDGEDHDSFPLDAADAAVAAGVRIVAIGFGSESGSEISVADPTPAPSGYCSTATARRCARGSTATCCATSRCAPKASTCRLAPPPSTSTPSSRPTSNRWWPPRTPDCGSAPRRNTTSGRRWRRCCA